MNLVNLPNGFRPTGADFLKREQNKAEEFARLREQLGRGVAKGLRLVRQSSDGSVDLSAGHGADGGGNAIVVLRVATLDLSGVTKPQTGKFRWVAVTLKYKQTEQGTAAGVSGAWAEKTDGYEVVLIEGAEASTKAAAAKPANATQALRVGDILFDDNGTRLAETSLADKPAWKAYADQKDGALDTKLQAKIAANILAAKKALFPVGFIYINVQNKTNPGTLLGFGTWARISNDAFLAQEGNRYQIGRLYGDGLPNIWGEFWMKPPNKNNRVERRSRGAFAIHSAGQPHPQYNSGGGDGHYAFRPQFFNVEFNASKGNAIYGRVGHVQPKTVGASIWRRVA